MNLIRLEKQREVMPALSLKIHSITSLSNVFPVPAVSTPQRLQTHNERSFIKFWLPGIVLVDFTSWFYLVLHKPRDAMLSPFYREIEA